MYDRDDTYNQKIQLSLTGDLDPSTLDERLAEDAANYISEPGNLSSDEGRAFYYTERRGDGSGQSKYPFLYYGEMVSILGDRFLLSASLRGYDYSGEGDVLGKLKALHACMQAVVSR